MVLDLRLGCQTYDTGANAYNLYNVSPVSETKTPKLGREPMASTEERVKNIVIDLLGVDEDRVVPAARFREDLEADSLDLVELIMAFEEEFGGEITDDDAQKITSVGEAVTYIQKNMGGT